MLRFCIVLTITAMPLIGMDVVSARRDEPQRMYGSLLEAMHACRAWAAMEGTFSTASSGGGDHRLRPAIRSCTLDLEDPVILAERYEVEENSVHAALPGALERSLQTTFPFLPERSETSSQS
jgi:hypothetical protein